MKRMFLSGIVLALASVAPAHAADTPKQSDAKAQMKFAASVKKGTRGLKGEERREKLKEAAEAYSAVARFFPEAGAEVAESHFRIGEIRRTIGDREGALISFEKSVASMGSRKFGARSLLEIGHLHRRAKKLPEALGSYLKSAREFADQADPRDESLLWAGKTKLALKEPEAARGFWKEVTEKGADPIDQIKAWDLIANSYIAEGKQAEASAAVEQCRHALAQAAEEPTNRGARVKKALDRMKSVKKIDPSLAEADRDGDEDDDAEG